MQPAKHWVLQGECPPFPTSLISCAPAFSMGSSSSMAALADRDAVVDDLRRPIRLLQHHIPACVRRPHFSIGHKDAVRCSLHQKQRYDVASAGAAVGSPLGPRVTPTAVCELVDARLHPSP